MFEDSDSDVSLTPAVCPKTDFSHWDPFQGSSKESLLQLGSSDSGHSRWPTLGDRLHQQLQGHSMAVESIRVTSTPPPCLLCLFFSFWPGEEFFPSQKQSSWPLGLKGCVEAVSGGWGRERITINEPGASRRPLRKTHRVREGPWHEAVPEEPGGRRVWCQCLPLLRGISSLWKKVGRWNRRGAAWSLRGSDVDFMGLVKASTQWPR